MTVSQKQNKIDIDVFRKKILDWYDKHQRRLPWRAVSNGKVTETPNPYYVWLSEIMLQQTTVVTVGPYFEKFTSIWPSVHDLAKAEKEEVMHEWAGLGYYARARNLHKCAQVVSNDLDGTFPKEQQELEKLPGIGGYTSAAIRAIAFNKPANVVDGNIERIMARIFAIKGPLPDSKKKLKELAGYLSDGREDRPGDYAQALMDLGATICIPKSPKCVLCPVGDMCEARKIGIAETLPAKKPKKAKPQKFGILYWIKNESGDVLFERRPDNVMLGGMIGLPTSYWQSEKPKNSIKSAQNLDLKVKHSFTHFDLTLEIIAAQNLTKSQMSKILPENDPIWVSQSKIGDLGVPTLFKKAVKLMK